jgi:hypothetical protein
MSGKLTKAEIRRPDKNPDYLAAVRLLTNAPWPEELGSEDERVAHISGQSKKYAPFGRDAAGYNQRQTDRFIFFRLQGLIRSKYDGEAVPSFPITRKVKIGVERALVRPPKKAASLHKYPGIPGRVKGPVKESGDLLYREDQEYTIGTVEVAYFAAIYPQLLKGIKKSGDTFSLEFNSPEESREILNTRKMSIQTSTTPKDKPAIPTTEVKETTPPPREIEQTKKEVVKILNKEADRKNDKEVAETVQSNTPQERDTNTSLIATYWKSDPRSGTRWHYGLSYNEPRLASSIGRMGRGTSRFFDKAYADLPSGLVSEDGQKRRDEFDITDLAIEHRFYDTLSDPEKVKFTYSYQYDYPPDRNNRETLVPVIRKREKTVFTAPTPEADISAPQEIDEDKWENNVIAKIRTYYNEKDKKYYAVVRASKARVSEDEKNDWERKLYAALVKDFSLSASTIEGRKEQGGSYQFSFHADARPGILPVMMTRVSREITETADRKTISELMLAEIQHQSDDAAVRKFAATLNQIDTEIATGTKVLEEYDNIIIKLGVNPADLGDLELRREIERYSSFPKRVRRMLSRNGVKTKSLDPGKDIIEIAFDKDFNPLHFFVKGNMYFDGIGRDPFEVENGDSYEPRGNVYIGYTPTTWGYIFYTPRGTGEENQPNGLITHASTIGTDATTPLTDFLTSYTYPPVCIAPTGVISPSSSEQLRTQGSSIQSSSETDGERNRRLALQREQMSNTVDDVLFSCKSNILEQINDLEELYGNVLNKISFTELIKSLLDKVKQDLQAQLALADVMGEIDDYRSEFNQILEEQVECVLDTVSAEIINSLTNLGEDVASDILAAGGLSAPLTFDFPTIPVDGLLGFVRELVEEAIEKAITEILLTVVKEAVEQFINCSEEGKLSLGKLGERALSDLTDKVDITSALNELSKKTGVDVSALVDDISSIMEVITSGELVNLLAGEVSDLLGEVIEAVVGALANNILAFFRAIGLLMSDQDLEDLQDESNSVLYCDEGEVLSEAELAKKNLEEKGSSRSDIVDQVRDTIDALKDKLGQICDLLDNKSSSNSSQEKVNSAIENIALPKEAMGITEKLQRAILRSHQQLVNNELESFIFSRTRDTKVLETDLSKTGVEGAETPTLDSVALIGNLYDPGDPPAGASQNQLRMSDSAGGYFTDASGTLETAYSEGIFSIGDLRVKSDAQQLEISKGQEVLFTAALTEELSGDYSEVLSDLNLLLPILSPTQIKERFKPTLTLNRPPTRTELETAGVSARSPFMNGTVYDRGSGLDFLNGMINPFLRDFDFNTEPSPPFDENGLYKGIPKSERQDYVEERVFSLQGILDDLGKSEETLTITNAAEKMAKASEQFAATIGLVCRALPFFLSYWAYSKEVPTDDDGTVLEGIVFGEGDIDQRRILVEYLFSVVKRKLEREKRYQSYLGAFITEDGMKNVFDKMLDNLFILEGTSDPVPKVDPKIQSLIDRRDSGQLEYPKTVSEVTAWLDEYDRQHVPQYQLTAEQRENAITLARLGYKSENSERMDQILPPWRVMTAMYPIYLHNSTNITQNLGITFLGAIKSADQLLYKAQNPQDITF